MTAFIGLAVITCDRVEYLKQCISSLETYNWGGADLRYVIIDEDYQEEKYAWLNKISNIKLIFQKNSGVGRAKNQAISALLNEGCEHLFLIEDDILMQDEKTCLEYIAHAEETDVPHLNFALHGEKNVGKRMDIKWQRGERITSIFAYPECVGAFSYYHASILNEVGLLDESFSNAWEHVEHTLRISMTKKIPPFWYFMDHPCSNKLLREIPGSIINSKIRSDPYWQEKVDQGIKYWMAKHGFFLPPVPNNRPK